MDTHSPPDRPDLRAILASLAAELAATYDPMERRMIIRQIVDIRAELIPEKEEE